MFDFYRYFEDENIKVYSDNDEDISYISDISNTFVVYQFSKPGAMGWGGICVAIDNKGNFFPMNFLKTERHIEEKAIYISTNALFEAFKEKVISKYPYHECDPGMGWYQGGDEELLHFLEDKANKEAAPHWDVYGYMQNYFVDILSPYIKDML